MKHNAAEFRQRVSEQGDLYESQAQAPPPPPCLCNTLACLAIAWLPGRLGAAALHRWLEQSCEMSNILHRENNEISFYPRQHCTFFWLPTTFLPEYIN